MNKPLSIETVPFSSDGAQSNAWDDLDWEDDVPPRDTAAAVHAEVSDSESDCTSQMDDGTYFILHQQVIRVHDTSRRASTPLDAYFRAQLATMDRKSVFRKVPANNSETNLALVGNFLVGTQLRSFVDDQWQTRLARIACARPDLSTLKYNPKTASIVDSKSPNKLDVRCSPNYGTRAELLVSFLTQLNESGTFISWFFLVTIYFTRSLFLASEKHESKGSRSSSSSLPEEVNAIVVALLQWRLPAFEEKTAWVRLELAKAAIRTLNPEGKMIIVPLFPPNRIKEDAVGRDSPALRRFDFWAPDPNATTAAGVIGADRLGTLDTGAIRSPSHLTRLVLVSTGLRWEVSPPETNQATTKFCEAMRTRRIKRSLFYLPTESHRLAHHALPPKPRRQVKPKESSDFKATEKKDTKTESTKRVAKTSLFADAKRKYEREKSGIKDRKRTFSSVSLS
jgi:hypothetical protein